MRVRTPVGFLALSVVIAAFAVSGCGTTWYAPEDPTPLRMSNVPRPAAHVIVREEDFPERAYSALGEVTATVTTAAPLTAAPTRDAVNQRLREEAAKLGADAVILVRYTAPEPGFFGAGTVTGRGRAIRFAQ